MLFRKVMLTFLALGLICISASSAVAAENSQTLWVTNPQLRVRIVMAPPVGSAPPSAQLDQYLLGNLSFLPFVSIIDTHAVPGGAGQAVASGPQLDLRRYQLAGAHMLVTTLWGSEGGKPKVELRAFDVTMGRFVFGKSYVNAVASSAPDIADDFCAEFMKSLTGSGDFFRATLAFVKTASATQKNVWLVKPTGRNLRRITNMAGGALSPAWSKDGRFIIFGHVDVRTHGLGVWNSANNQVQRIRFPGNTVIAPKFTPDNKVVVTLSTGRNPGIFLLDHQFRRESTVENSASIDVSPSLDASGTKMAFVSSRMGNPHVFVKDLRTGAVKRITYEGKYNTEPSISPDGTLVAFSRMVGGKYRIFVHDLVRQTETQVSFGPGNDEQPAFSPDNYFVAFASTRSGKRQIYLTTRNGGEARLIPTGDGDAFFPAWGPAAR